MKEGGTTFCNNVHRRGDDGLAVYGIRFEIFVKDIAGSNPTFDQYFISVSTLPLILFDKILAQASGP
ncbi:hypothetical protein J6590_023929 [Homalodisca vitripennis]|nr:hypothetical protein J6590_023929 [Homalodisca vitripennis]